MPVRHCCARLSRGLMQTQIAETIVAKAQSSSFNSMQLSKPRNAVMTSEDSVVYLPVLLRSRREGDRSILQHLLHDVAIMD